MCRNSSTHNDSKDTNVRNLHRVLVEGDGVEALGLLQDDGGGGTQASLTCVEATAGTALSVKRRSNLWSSASKKQVNFKWLATGCSGQDISCSARETHGAQRPSGPRCSPS